MAILNPTPQIIPSVAEDQQSIGYFKSLNDSLFQIWSVVKGLVDNENTQGYTDFANLTEVKTLDADSTTVEELADVLGTLIKDLKTKEIIGD